MAPRPTTPAPRAVRRGSCPCARGPAVHGEGGRADRGRPDSAGGPGRAGSALSRVRRVSLRSVGRVAVGGAPSAEASGSHTVTVPRPVATPSDDRPASGPQAPRGGPTGDPSVPSARPPPTPGMSTPVLRRPPASSPCPSASSVTSRPGGVCPWSGRGSPDAPGPATSSSSATSGDRLRPEAPVDFSCDDGATDSTTVPPSAV